MAVTISVYNSSIRRLVGQQVNFLTLKLMLLDNNAVFNATHTTLSGPAGPGNANQVSGNGWTAGGELVSNVTVTTVDTNDAMLDAENVIKKALGGPIGPAHKAVLYDDSDTNDGPLVFVDFGEPITAGENTDFLVAWSEMGILRFVLP